MTAISDAPPVIIIGASLAGVNVAAALRRSGVRSHIEIVGEETDRPYNRPPLSKELLTRKASLDRIWIKAAESLEVSLRLGCTAKSLDIDNQSVRVAEYDGSEKSMHFSTLVIACGAKARRPAGFDGSNVFTFRKLTDFRNVAQVLESSSRVAIVGAGFIGSEVAASMRTRGIVVDLIDPMATPLAGLGPRVGGIVARLHRERGCHLHMGRAVRTLHADQGCVKAVELDDGTVLDTDLVVLGMGVRPSTEWLQGSGLNIEDGILCDGSGRVLSRGSAHGHVFAAGDVARWNHPRYGAVRVEHWHHAVAQARHVAKAIVGPDSTGPLQDLPFFWSDQFDTKIQVAGIPAASAEMRVLVEHGGKDQLVGALVINDQTIAIIGVNSPTELLRYKRKLFEGQDIF